MKIEFNDLEPIYIQIVNYFKVMIASKQIEGGEKMPSVRELSADIGVNPNTIQRAYSELERDELLYTQRGKGKYVTEDQGIIKGLRKSMSKGLIDKFINEMNDLGFSKDEIIEIISEN